ncbi:tungsten formylmethanofuran dehydrogenase [Methylocella silvestris]|uniref:Tungsten formylmethanofuran dehydrogenase n=1 Tax=Methylocella silvestris TaxID=199596 RepID=A0A2J7TH83_METSI|nr:tungsten formylmethanofuran dehydrogenase [Methylocella silvestris]PNG26128.1 tungsten formylmethanofuran dehydrogenase [Methylocella silvestris]
MADALIDGKPASLEAAAARAAQILVEARLPLVAGLGADVAGTSAAILLAERLRGAYDHMRSDEIFTDLDVVRQAGAMVTTPSVARLRADVLVFIGDDLTEIWPELIDRLAPAEIPPFDLEKSARQLVWIAPPKGAAIEGVSIKRIETANIAVTLAALRARVAGKPVALAGEALEELDAVAAILNKARFGVFVWGPRRLDRLCVEMATGLIIDLNKTTRFTGLPLGTSDNAAGVTQTSGWSTGFPTRTSFGRGYPEHDTWRFDAVRLIESGEADAALWISAYSPSAPQWTREVPLIALVPKETSFAREPAVRIDIGRPGVDHDGADFSREVSALVAREATRRSDAPSTASFLKSIAEQIARNAGQSGEGA